MSNKELENKVLWTISEELLTGGHVLESEREPLAKEIIKLVRDNDEKELINAIINESYDGSTESSIYVYDAIKAIRNYYGDKDE